MTTADSSPAPSPSRPGRRFGVPVLFYAHPFEVALGVILVVNGVRQLATTASSPAVDALLPAGPVLAYRVLGLIAGVAIIAGLLIRERALGRAIERAGCWLAAGGYLAYAALLGARYGLDADSIAVLLNTLAVAAGCLLRARAITLVERVILATYRAANADPEALRRLVDGRPPASGDVRPQA